MEKGGIPCVIVTSLMDISEVIGAPRIVRGQGLTWNFGNAYLTVPEQLAMRRATLEKCLEVLQLTPTKPTTFYPNYGNVVGDQQTYSQTFTKPAKDWDWNK
jgi:betaine reductase